MSKGIKKLIQFSLVAACVFLCGCPTATNPTQQQEPAGVGSATRPSSTEPLPGGASSSSQTANQMPASPSVSSGHANKSSRSTSTSARSDSGVQAQQQSVDNEQFVDLDDNYEPGEPEVGDQRTMANATVERGLPGGEQQDPDFSDEPMNHSGVASSDDTSTLDGPLQETDDVEQVPAQLGTAASVVPTTGAVTTTEKISLLDRELLNSTGQFDQMILRERETIRHQARNAGGAIQPSGIDQLESLEDNAPSIAADAEQLPGASQNSASSTAKHGKPTQVATYSPPADIPDGNDDDVVARQLREAAMTEPDARLREKLWEEYRKYKGIDQ